MWFQFSFLPNFKAVWLQVCNLLWLLWSIIFPRDWNQKIDQIHFIIDYCKINEISLQNSLSGGQLQSKIVCFEKRLWSYTYAWKLSFCLSINIIHCIWLWGHVTHHRVFWSNYTLHPLKSKLLFVTQSWEPLQIAYQAKSS